MFAYNDYLQFTLMSYKQTSRRTPMMMMIALNYVSVAQNKKYTYGFQIHKPYIQH